MDQKNKNNFFYAISLGLQLGLSIAIPLAGFIWLGIFLDKKFDNSPFFLILFLLLGIGFAFFEIWQFILPFLEKKK